ncbi:MAG: YggS family pyridoxal phosphate-dependent enzyme [Acidimicrobiia bacterium]|nr:YggS family pyridoxal phosphate-dependent enzyme [Acidimicrobiia bacterium]
MNVDDQLTAVRARIEAAGGDPDQIAVLAVTKGFDRRAVDAAVAAGLLDVGENYAQELSAKVVDAPPGVRWHFIGRLQRNKVRTIAAHVALWQSVDRAELGAEIAKRAPGAEVLAQVNVSGEATKGGCPPDDVPALVRDLQAEGLDVRGLMTVGATGPAEAARPGFALLRDLADRLSLPVRSMGMTGDLEVAVQEGATMIRVGTALFGSRRA